MFITSSSSSKVLLLFADFANRPVKWDLLHSLTTRWLKI